MPIKPSVKYRDTRKRYAQSERGRAVTRKASLAYYYRHPNARREQNYKNTFGITLADYDEMVANQNGVCAVCGGNRAPSRRLVVDHDHATGKIRGLLCVMCNTAMGQAKDDPGLLRKLADWIEFHRNKE